MDEKTTKEENIKKMIQGYLNVIDNQPVYTVFFTLYSFQVQILELLITHDPDLVYSNKKFFEELYNKLNNKVQELLKFNMKVH